LLVYLYTQHTYFYIHTYIPSFFIGVLFLILLILNTFYFNIYIFFLLNINLDLCKNLNFYIIWIKLYFVIQMTEYANNLIIFKKLFNKI